MITFKQFIEVAGHSKVEITEARKSVQYREPDFNYEYSEVEHQQEIGQYFKTRAAFMKAAHAGVEQVIPASGLDHIENHDDHWAGLESDKAHRAVAAFKGGEVELPILLKDGDYLYLLAGNTRMAYARKIKAPVHAWVINTPGLKERFLSERLAWHDSDAPDANGKFKDLGINDLADWLIKTRDGNAQRINGSLQQQIIFNRKRSPSYAKKMESVRAAVKRKLEGRK